MVSEVKNGSSKLLLSSFHELEKTRLGTKMANFFQHVQFMFSGPLKDKNEEEKSSFLMVWVGEKGRSMFQTWNSNVENKKKLQG